MGKTFEAAGIVHVWRPESESPHWERVAAVTAGFEGRIAAFDLVKDLLARAARTPEGRSIAGIVVYAPSGQRTGHYILSQAAGEQPMSDWFPQGTRSTWTPQEPLEACRILINRIRGTHITEDDLLDHALDHGETTGGKRPTERYRSGGTTPEQRIRLLADYGVQAASVGTDAGAVLRAIGRGQGLITSHDPGILWDNVEFLGGAHAVITAGMAYGPDGTIESVTVLDTGTGNCSEVIPIARYLKSLLGGPTFRATRTAEKAWLT